MTCANLQCQYKSIVRQGERYCDPCIEYGVPGAVAQRQMEDFRASVTSVKGSVDGRVREKRMTEKRPMTEAEENLVSCAVSMLCAGSGATMEPLMGVLQDWARSVQRERAPTPTKEEVDSLRDTAMVARRAFRAAHIALYASDPRDDTLELTHRERAVVEAAKRLVGWHKPGTENYDRKRRLVFENHVVCAPDAAVADLFEAVRRLP